MIDGTKREDAESKEHKEMRKVVGGAKPFEVTRLDEDRVKDTDRNLSLRLNEEFQAMLREDCDLLNTDQEAAAIKIMWKAGRNAIRGTIGEETVRWLESPTRIRKRSRHRKGGENVLQENAKL